MLKIIVQYLMKNLFEVANHFKLFLKFQNIHPYFIKQYKILHSIFIDFIQIFELNLILQILYKVVNDCQNFILIFLFFLLTFLLILIIIFIKSIYLYYRIDSSNFHSTYFILSLLFSHHFLFIQFKSIALPFIMPIQSYFCQEYQLIL